MTILRTSERRDLTTEYVSGGAGLWSPGYARALPWAFDDLTQDFGDDLYERMQLDPQVLAVVNILRTAIIEEGVRLESPVSDEAADGYELGQEIEEFCEAVLADLQISLDDVLWDLLQAIALGSRVAEQVYQDRPATAYALPGTSPISRTQQMLVLSALKPKPRRSTAFVVDAFMNVLAIAGLIPGGGYGLSLATTDIRNLPSAPNVFARNRFAVLTFRPKDSDPRGTTLLRPVYWPWFAKQQIWQEFMKYLAQFASASIVITASEDATKNGVKVTNTDGSTQIKPAVQVLAQAAEDFRNGSYLTVPYGTLVEALKVSGDGEAFYRGFTLCDQQITMAALHQTLATMEGQHQSRASSEEHANTMESVQRQAKRSVCAMLHRDVLRPLVAYNYDVDIAQKLTPLVSLGEVEHQDFAAMANAVASLAKSGYLDTSQYAGIDKQLNLPPRAAQSQASTPEPAVTEEESDDAVESL